MNRSVYIIILNWNGLQDTIECVQSCLRLDYPSFHIVLVDNGSSDQSENTLRKMFPGLHLIQTGTNLGYAGGNNVGIRYALDKGADYIWLLNNDTIVSPDSLNALVASAESEPSFGMVGSKVLSYSKPAVLLYAGGLIDLTTGETKHIGYGCEDDGRFNHPCDTDYITGCSMLVAARVIEEIGLMDEAYFLYFEETEWCFRAKVQGYRLLYEPASVVYHKESVSVRKIDNVMIYYLTRNRLHFLRQSGVKPDWMKRFAIDLQNLLRCIRRNEASGARYIIKAYRHWITGRMGPLPPPWKSTVQGPQRLES